MNPLLKKLNFKGQEKICILNAPDSFNPGLAEVGEEHVFSVPGDGSKLEFVMVFATAKQQLNELVKQVVPELEEDAVFWVCYPKGTSKKYKCDFNRDTGWELMGEFAMEPVRQISVDQDWTALRFRKASNIKKITRSEKMALSKEGRQRARKEN